MDNMDNNKKFTKKISSGIGISLLIIIPLFIGVLYLRSVIKSTTETIVSSREQFAEKAASLNALVNLRYQYRNFGKAYLNVLYNVIPIKDDLINISKELESVATRNDLGFGFSFKSEKEASGKELGYLQYSLNIEGESIAQIQSFIEDLNDFKYLNSVDSLSFKRKIEGKTEKITALVEGRVYFRSDT